MRLGGGGVLELLYRFGIVAICAIAPDIGVAMKRGDNAGDAATLGCDVASGATAKRSITAGEVAYDPCSTPLGTADALNANTGTVAIPDCVALSTANTALGVTAGALAACPCDPELTESAPDTDKAGWPAEFDCAAEFTASVDRVPLTEGAVAKFGCVALSTLTDPRHAKGGCDEALSCAPLLGVAVAADPVFGCVAMFGCDALSTVAADFALLMVDAVDW